jgi:hypothetical protein
VDICEKSAEGKGKTKQIRRIGKNRFMKDYIPGNERSFGRKIK